MSCMKRYALILFIIITFASNAAVAMASETGNAFRNGVIAYVIGLVCLSFAAAFLIMPRR
ncbi:MAG: hypothetical protein JXC85_04570 [Candidatus Aenigmarchaeota archaeon]|nr:hypothetical protein [Candidatus Aenigmarchaeota archaeon]